MVEVSSDTDFAFVREGAGNKPLECRRVIDLMNQIKALGVPGFAIDFDESVGVQTLEMSSQQCQDVAKYIETNMTGLLRSDYYKDSEHAADRKFIFEADKWFRFCNDPEEIIHVEEIPVQAFTSSN